MRALHRPGSDSGARQRDRIPSRPGLNASVLRDPNGLADERYKLLVRRAGNLEGLVSPDGLRWRPVSHNPLLDSTRGYYDSHNVLLWDDERGVYVIYMRGFVDESGR